MRNQITVRQVLCAALLALANCTANAATITFDGLTGSNFDPFGSYSEGGFSVVATQGSWVEAHLFGAPTPDIFSIDPVAEIQVTNNLSTPFTFESVDIGLAGGSDVKYTVTGLLNGESQFVYNGDVTSVNFKTVLGSSSTPIDKLLVTIDKSGASSFNIDNIQVSAVPEVSTLAQMCLGLAGLCVGAVSKRRRFFH